MRFEYKRRKHYVELQKIQSSAFGVIGQKVCVTNPNKLENL